MCFILFFICKFMSHSTPISQLPRFEESQDLEESRTINNILNEIEQTERKMQQPMNYQQQPPVYNPNVGGQPIPPQPPMRPGDSMPPGLPPNPCAPEPEVNLSPPKKSWSDFAMQHGKEPLIIFVLVFLIQMKFVTKIIGNYIPKSFDFNTGSMTWFGVAVKALLVALIIFLIKFLKLI